MQCSFLLLSRLQEVGTKLRELVRAIVKVVCQVHGGNTTSQVKLV